MKCGERVLLPAVRQAGQETLIITNGFSCREQIAQATERRALHLAQVIQMALRESRREAPAISEEQPAALMESTLAKILTGVGLLLTSGALLWQWQRFREI